MLATEPNAELSISKSIPELFLGVGHVAAKVSGLFSLAGGMRRVMGARYTHAPESIQGVCQPSCRRSASGSPVGAAQAKRWQT
jgi:hypothetical protein